MVELRKPFIGHYPITDDFLAHKQRASNAPGIDFALPESTPILAVADGRVVR